MGRQTLNSKIRNSPSEKQNNLPLIPFNWVWTRLGEICLEPQYGWTTSASKTGKLHLLRTTDITSGYIDWDSVPFCKEEPFDKEKYLLKDGDIVISRAGSIGYSHLIKNPQEAVFASYLIRFRPLIDEKYLSYFLRSPSYWESNSEKSLGIAVPNVNATKLRDIEVPLPPLPEQHRIVAKIEELFTRLDAGVGALKKIKAQLKRYRQSVLKYAFEGKLTNRLGDFRFEIERLDKACEIIMGQSPPGNTYNKDGKGLPFFQGKADFGKIYPKPSTWCTSPKKIANPNDILISVRAPVGPTNLCNMQCCIGRGLAAVRPLHNINSFYVFYYLRSIEPIISKMGTGSTFSAISKSQIANLKIPFPPLPEQQKIVEEIERRFSVADEVEKVVDQSLKQAERLRQSILKRAFEGKLVPQWPDLPAPQPGKYWVYVIKCANDSNYIGQTDNLRKRWEEHLSGEGADWTKLHHPQYIMYWEEFSSRKEAVIREKWLKTGFGRKWIKREEKAGRLWHVGEPAEKLLERIKAEKAKLTKNAKIKTKRSKTYGQKT